MSSQPPNDGLLASSATDKASGSRWGVLALCAVAQFMVVLDVSIVNVALPQMKHDLSLSLTGQQWVVNAYNPHLRRLLDAGRTGLGLLWTPTDLYSRPRPLHAREPRGRYCPDWCVAHHRSRLSGNRWRRSLSRVPHGLNVDLYRTL